jgi:glycosyltransferase involved in cell wall biosynthesis
LKRRIVVAPRGEFCAGAISIKTSKKLFYLRLSHALGVYRNVVWQASTQDEIAEIRNFFPSAQCQIAKELAPSVSVGVARSVDKEIGQLKMIFVSRISQKKNLHFALQVLALVKHASVVFDIYGPLEDRHYWEQCEAQIAQLPSHVEVHYRGELEHADVHACLAAHHLFFLPTLAENFGYAILEALLAGRPVLISDQTPWRQLGEDGAGFDIALADVAAYVSAIERYAAMDGAQFDAVIAQVNAFVQRYAMKLNEDVHCNRQLFARALS